MKKHRPILLLLVISTVFIFISCKDEKNEDLTNTVNKNGAVETSVTVAHLDSLYDVLITKHAVWYKGTQFKNVEYRDTVPALGKEKRVAEDNYGYEKNVEANKEYEIFITVK
ncbi:MAG: hypothetical protein ACOYLO_01475 [Ferruginibacter sp.]